MAKVPKPTESFPMRKTLDGIDSSRDHGTAGGKLWPKVHRTYDDWCDSKTGRRVPKPDWASDDDWGY